MDSNTIVLGFNGLPYISGNYRGEKAFAQRAKVKRAFQQIGDVKRLFINSDTGSGNVLLDVSSYKTQVDQVLVGTIFWRDEI